ncbi:hypothetical protein [Rufibacter sp. LB8]|uniref:hypothetical protein n=1 Tax=Rufibacter sp. LB8 TaxID=2777781 RepID=UPI00178C8132|nr:hypothetical protein [Rufibacter sp. LB8]
MNFTRALLFGLVLFLFMASCNPATRNIYTSQSFSTAARQHKTIAILPFDVKVGLRPSQMKRMTPEKLYDLELKHGRAVQSTLQMYFMKYINHQREVIAVQDVRETNRILQEKDIQPEQLHAIPPTELAAMLGVDAVMTGRLTTEKPYSNAFAMALAAYTFLYTTEVSNGGPTNMGTATIQIHDGATGNLLWNYDKMLARSLGSDTHTIVKAISRKASKKIPYARLRG